MRQASSRQHHNTFGSVSVVKGLPASPCAAVALPRRPANRSQASPPTTVILSPLRRFMIREDWFRHSLLQGDSVAPMCSITDIDALREEEKHPNLHKDTMALQFSPPRSTASTATFSRTFTASIASLQGSSSAELQKRC
ncbi:hypothetical protein E2542_SST05014 [Spatholobus suberectus]|nr:hypothetical protein E2542_SST05014 [Spatholobus suberectus]